MTMNPNIPTDEELTAFIDGELPVADSEQLARLIENDETIAERVAFLAGASLPLAEAYAPLLDDAPRDRLRAMLDTVPSSAPSEPDTGRQPLVTRRVLAAMAASIVAGVLLDRALLTFDRSETPESSDWRSAVADYIALYTAETLAGPAPDLDAQMLQLSHFNGDLGLSLSPGTVALPGAEFRQAQLLRYNDHPLAQLLYLDPQTGPVALCIVASKSGVSTPETESRKGMNVVYWSDGTHAYMLIGHTSTGRMAEMAQAVRSRMTS
jgi:anti-sigma factor RsiW